MADGTVIESAPVVSSPAAKKGKDTAASKQPRVKSTHPPTSDMVNSAIKDLKERSGSSLQAIKKYIAAHYKVDVDKLSPFIKKYLKTAVTGGKLIQTKGKGASGSFKLAAPAKSESAQKKIAAPKIAKAATGEKKSKPKKAASPAKTKKPVAKSGEKKKAAAPAKTAKPASSAKSVKVQKEKTTKAKASAEKPKTPKPKKVAPKKAAAPKKK